MLDTLDIPESTETRPEPRKRFTTGMFGLLLMHGSTNEYQTEDGTGGIIKSEIGRGWEAWHGDETKLRASMKEAAHFARHGK